MSVLSYHVGAVIPNEEGEVLLVYRNKSRLIRPNTWFIPTGKVYDGELPSQGIIREVEEEVGLIIQPRSIIWSREDPEQKVPEIAYLCDVIGGTLGIKAFDEISAAGYFPLDSLPEETHQLARKILEAYTNKK
ncbi:NUDIX hydrolase [Candidatus Woesearchaeota archaeon]|nr:NUDIX hydrolase [Candidatus Woesearchaeota archaeon]